jgi:hypothetical protein
LDTKFTEDTKTRREKISASLGPRQASKANSFVIFVLFVPFVLKLAAGPIPVRGQFVRHPDL